MSAVRSAAMAFPDIDPRRGARPMSLRDMSALRTADTSETDVSGVDAAAGLLVEEVQAARVDGERDRLAFAGARHAIEAADEAAVAAAGRLELGLHRLLAERLAHLVRHDRPRVHREVREHLRAHVLADVELRGERASREVAVDERRILDVLRP